MSDERVPLFVRLGGTESRQLASAAASTGKTKRQLVEDAVREHLSNDGDGLVVGRIALRETLPEVMTLGEAASFLRLEEPALEAAAAAGELPAGRIGREWRFSRAALLDWLADAHQTASAA